MDISIAKTPSSNTPSPNMVQTWVLQLILVVTALAERCTKAVPVQTIPTKKVTVLRRVPATCSNWDKAWAWLTKVDCGTKYRLDHVTVPPREIKQYKLEYGCCEGDTDCKEAKGIQATNFDSTDEKFLAIVLGSTAACVVIVIIIFAITFYTKKSRCQPPCDPVSHIYASADEDDTQQATEINEKSSPEESDTDQKACDADYAEIGDRLPRYTDIFKDSLELREDPFNKASAPPLYSEVNSNNYINSDPSLKKADIYNTSQSVCKKSNSVFIDDALKLTSASLESKHYNGKEKKKRKRASSDSHSSGGTKASDPETALPKHRKNRSSVPSSLEIIKSSAGEHILEKADTKHKRRSAQFYTVSPNTSTVSRSNSTSTCSVIYEAPLAARRTKERRIKLRQSEDSLDQKASKKAAGEDVHTVLATNSVVITSSNDQCERDSLLMTPSCHSGCGSDKDCEHCLNYDRLEQGTDVCSVHLYQSLEDLHSHQNSIN
ncbi:uncharacterized protein LOC106051972 [Biomphalaria glabrata]|uniref:Uncharacterized protein LOC106051972 n=1 Tax=Biomphalaria glabrata TaxID=6526 RepID=A0A9W3AVY3_BIOGL|nr:uncharacterized protein LOC106051972 [Biomphalaria glabrata]XP_055891380.1 uncharacterized protein LOC106051972 [Biomphalaria glabrata]XP_055891382.1 uncharacterized protein LOC106051972 [Biomphalaria glabrata]XP_055891383.1 uncharacterized protein LOC106051972 [Biomphalaria glabrata]XP_055891384.1 uncharacterized protein LOC106051972 [Biomphalaria glabrata]